MRRINVAFFTVCVGAALFGGYILGVTGRSPAVSKPADGWEGTKEQAQDAVRRWSIKARQSEDSVRQSWSPRSMFVPTRNQGSGMLCIELRLKPGNLGGSPVYCYRDQTTDLVADYSDVE